LEGLLADQQRAGVVNVHQDAQRLLEPVLVVNPFAEQLTFADARTRTRRDHVKYLTLIRAIALLHQHQRTRRHTTTPEGRRVAYIEATVADVALANRLAHEVLGRSLDELPPQTRRLLELLDGIVAERAADKSVDRDQVRLTRRELREQTGWSDTALKVHLARLVDLELVLAHRPDRGGVFCYELAWDGTGRAGERFLIGLADPAALRYDDTRSGPEPAWSGPGQGPVSPRSGGGQGDIEATKLLSHNGFEPSRTAGNGNGTVPGDDGGRVMAAHDRRAG
jgi:hypothetical protein